MNLINLQRFVPPPSQPIDAPSLAEWETYQLITGILLPPDFQELLSAYGSGDFDTVVFLYNPFCRSLYTMFKRTLYEIMVDLQGIRYLKTQGDAESFPYAVYPDPGGVFPWARTSNGDQLFWLTTGEPSQWTIVLNESHSRLFEHFSCTTTEFLYGIMTGALHSEIISRDDFRSPPIFLQPDDHHTDG